jgi:hypothetical protein
MPIPGKQSSLLQFTSRLSAPLRGHSKPVGIVGDDGVRDSHLANGFGPSLAGQTGKQQDGRHRAERHQPISTR